MNEEKSKRRTCPKCGRGIAYGSKNCDYCGTIVKQKKVKKASVPTKKAVSKDAKSKIFSDFVIPKYCVYRRRECHLQGISHV